MSALAKDRDTLRKDLYLQSYPVAAAATIYKGAMVATDSDGYLVPASDTAGLEVVGVAYEQADNSSGADGDIDCRVSEGVYRFAASSITQIMCGQIVYVVDDQTIDDAIGTNGIKAGRLVEFISTTEGWIRIQPASVGVTTANATDLATAITLVNDIKAKLNANFA